jgi:hypothetical protein
MPPDRERDLEMELRELGPRLDYPPTPDIATTVRQRLEEGNERRPARPGWLTALSPRWAAAVLVLLLAVPIFSPAVRDALSGLFVAGEGTGGAAQSGVEDGGEAGDDAAGRAYPEAPIMQEHTGSDLPASASSASSSGSESSDDQQAIMEDTGGDLTGSGGQPQAQGALGQDLGLGERVTLQEARARAGKVFVPLEIGKPDAVYATGREGVVLVYRARSDLPPLGNTGLGLILTELPGNVRSASFLEGPRPHAGAEAVGVDGGRGYWVPKGGSADPDRSGGSYANVLLWEREGRALRIESNLSRGEAIRIAESVR